MEKVDYQFEEMENFLSDMSKFSNKQSKGNIQNAELQVLIMILTTQYAMATTLKELSDFIKSKQ